MLAEQLALADSLLVGSAAMLTPQDLPGRYGRVVHAIDRVLSATKCEAVVGGGWAVWRHGYVNRVTQDIDIVLAASQIDNFLKAASVSGFNVLDRVPGRWPKLEHKDTGIQVDILPEGERPGVPPDLAPTKIPSPKALGAVAGALKYIELQGLVELKLAAGRMKDKADIVELLRVNPDQSEQLREHLTQVHTDYVAAFDQLLQEAQKSSS